MLKSEGTVERHSSDGQMKCSLRDNELSELQAEAQVIEAEAQLASTGSEDSLCF